MFKWMEKVKEVWENINDFIDMTIQNKHLRYITKGFSVFVIIIIFLIVVDMFRTFFRYLIGALVLIATLYMLGVLVERTKEIREKNIREKNDKPQYQQQDKKTHQGNKRE